MGSAPVSGEPVILAFGDSLTAGFGVRQEESYPSRLQVILRREGFPHRVVNAGVSGDTTAGGARRIRWALQHQPEVVILELGANDGLRGLSLAEMASNLAAIIRTCQQAGARVLLTGMKLTPNLGEAYISEFANTFDRLAQQYHTAFMPFFLEGVAGRRGLTQPDGIHPLGAGYAIVAQKVWAYLKPMLQVPKAGN